MEQETIAVFYELSRDLAAIERERFDQAEGKAWRYLYVLVILLGFALVSSGRTAIGLLDGSTSSLEWAFIVSFGLFVLCSVSAGLISVWNFHVYLTLEPPVDRSIEQFAIGSSVDRFHLELGREFMRAAAENRQVADRKYHLIKWNFRLLVAALILGLVLGGLFVSLSRGT